VPPSVGIRSFSTEFRAESVGAARFTNDVCVDSFAVHTAAPPSTEPPLDELDVDSPESSELAPDEVPSEASSPSYGDPDEPLLLDPPPVLPPFELPDKDDGSPAPGSAGAAVAQCARPKPKPRQRMTTPDRWVDFFMVLG
jgi:hypothetical protein